MLGRAAMVRLSADDSAVLMLGLLTCGFVGKHDVGSLAKKGRHNSTASRHSVHSHAHTHSRTPSQRVGNTSRQEDRVEE